MTDSIALFSRSSQSNFIKDGVIGSLMSKFPKDDLLFGEVWATFVRKFPG
jgi:hypothetical protein